ncbi:hypothetical protein QAO71_17105 (plasmid) [Halopseudomonas sp. SMJS2]|uniref:hypothetical protein n=1 Tax=Halopseudomonas sp. SMJS2 TaxID=3041098 RepID=UPI0024533CD3|nr:hypothetical protein [Halopseudomonas sp. SMJS2]WGK63488.1 hypothetical protein QAO71_17105 [Halopseudomonas sp. SMJS2]
MNAIPNTPTSRAYRPMPELCELWNLLSDVPVTAAGAQLDEPFLHFDKGTDVEEVWHWFELQNALFTVAAAGSRIGPDHPFHAPGLVEQALAHIIEIHPSVTQVVYDDDLRWCYTDSQGVGVTFKGVEDIGLLEEAADEAYERRLQNIPVTQ